MEGLDITRGDFADAELVKEGSGLRMEWAGMRKGGG